MSGNRTVGQVRGGSRASSIISSIKKVRPFLPAQLNKALLSLSRDQSIKILPAEKGGKVVIMDSVDYSQKAVQLLDDQQTHEMLSSNLLETGNSSIRAKIRQLSKKKSGSRHHQEISYHQPISFLFLRDCKNTQAGLPLAPIISNAGAVSRPLAGWVAPLLSPYLWKFSEAHLSDTQQCKEKHVELSNSNLTNQTRMTSLDVTSLFTNVPSEDVLNFVERKITVNQIIIPISCDVFISLLRVWIEGNVYEFSGR